MTEAVHLVALGARTPVGLTAASSAAAVRAGISRLQLHPYFVDPTGERLRGAIDGVLDPAIQGVARLLEFAAHAVSEVASQLPPEMSKSSRPIPLFLSVPEHRPGFSPRDEARLVGELQSKAPIPLSVTLTHRGHAGALAGLALAAEAVRAGHSDLALVGGVESYFHADTIDWLIDNDQIAMDGGRSPFMPGEGAAAVAIMSGGLRARLRIPSLAVLRGAHTARETSLIKTDDVNLARALTSVVRQATASLRLPHEAINDTWCDLNGERYRTDEWSYVLLRLPQIFRQVHGKPTRYNTAVDSWGDMGSATGALLVVLAVRAWQRQYASGPRALLFAGSEQGLRSAVVFEQGA